MFFLTGLDERQAADSDAIESNAAMPPSLALITVALGPIRGLIVDALWWKVVDLQESSDYFEILPITEWITAMEPRNPYVWTFHAWNLAYNIASSFPTPETRWKWIYNGVKLLRDDARKFNPGNKFIQSELALLISDKISSLSDPQRDFMIERWIKTKEPYFDSGLRPNLRRLVSPSTPEYAKQAELLKKETGMDPERMLRIDIEYGPFQWKLPQASSVYWGIRENDKDYTQGDLNYRAVINASMTQAFLFGSYVMNPKGDVYVTTANLDIAANVLKLLENDMKTGGTTGGLARAQLGEFASYAASVAYAFDRPDVAAMLYRAEKSLSPNSTPPYDKFISVNLVRLMDSAIPRLHQTLVEISLYNAYKALARGDGISAARFAESARKRWDDHMRDFGGPGSRFSIPPFENIKMAAYARTLRRLAGKNRGNEFVKQVSEIKTGPLKLSRNATILDYSVAGKSAAR